MKRKGLLNRLITVLCIVSMLSIYILPAKTVQAAPITSSGFLKANQKVLRNNYGNGDVVQLQGTNAGGYMLQEFWMTPTVYSTGSYTVGCEMDIYETLTSRFGEATMRDLVGVYQNNYWTEKDFDNCQALGMNCIRLPLWYMNFVDFNGNYNANAFDCVDWFIQEAGERGIYVIIDMHGAPGSQNGSDHSGIDGGNAKEAGSEFFFGSNAYKNQQLYYDLWYKIAQRYNGNPTVAGYDLLNEPYCTYRYTSSYSDATLHTMLWDIYNNAYNVIRSVDKDHVIIMEATWDAGDLPNPTTYGWTNVMYEYHNYLYDDYDNANGGQITNMQNKINNILNQGYNVPSYMGEFSYMNNPSAWQQGLKLLNDSGLSWTTWTYKVTGTNNNWGIYNQNIPTVNVATDSSETIRSRWSAVGTSTPNTTLLNAIKPYFKGQPNTTVAAIPGQLEAEKFNTMSGIQTETCSEGGLNVGFMDTGDYMDYSVNVASAGSYKVDYRVASTGTTGQLQLRSGSTTLATTGVPNTGGWQTWQTVSATVNLNAGAQTLRVYVGGSGLNLNWVNFTKNQTAQSIPGKIEAESFSVMSGIQTETCSEGGTNVGYMDAGDYMDYNVNVAAAGSYTFQYRVASTGTTGQLQLRSGSTTLATTSIPNTSGWQTWQTVNATANLNAGNQTIRLYVGGSGFNMNYFNVVAATTSNVMWFRNFEATGGITAGANATVASDASSANSGGVRSVKLTVSSAGDPATALRCVNVTPQSGASVNTTGKNHLIFNIRDTQGVNTMKVTIVDTSNAVWSGWTSAAAVLNQWTKITLPLSSVTGINKAAIKEIRIGEWNSGTYYIDDIYFAVNTTDGVPVY